ncbi:MAG: Ni/Fe-hydrogenase cytochrome b subunit [Thermodesulfobacteriota bacterium]
MSAAKPIGGRLATPAFLLFSTLLLIGFFFIGQRFLHGIGQVSNMSDGYPWGIWIAFDVVIGTALACGGYAMALMVYVFNKGQYHSLVRPALLASVLGYSLAGLGVFIDIGRYWQIYNVFVPGYVNANSVMLEVALCIASYILVLWIEFAPALFEKARNATVLAVLNKVLFLFIALGILLPTMHQSSLGSMMILAGQKLSPLWWSPILPLLFLVSALFMGYAVVIFEASLSTVAFQRRPETPLLARMATVIPKLVAVFLVIRLADILIRGHLGLAFRGDLRGNLFLLELLLHLVPVFLIASDGKTRGRPLFLAALSLLLGGVLFRINTYIIGYDPGSGWHYFPAVPEICITLGIFSLEILAYAVFVKKIPVLSTHD